jgi:hypothetical protein
MGILNTCLNKSCQVWTIKDGYRLKQNLQSKVLAIGLGLVSGVARAKAEGKKLGRPRKSTTAAK